MSDAPRIFIMAGEPSGDLLGARLLAALKAKHPNLNITGIGGPLMEKEGLQSLVPMNELALMGFAEIVPHLPRLLGHMFRSVDNIMDTRPPILITIDSPGFNFRIAQRVRQLGYKGTMIHYVAPSVWAYKPERAQKIAAWYNHLLCLLPFEPPYFEKVGLKASFVGHPVAWEWKTKGDAATFRTRHNIAADAPVLCLLPGSRKGEINRHLSVMQKTLENLSQRLPNLVPVMVVPPRFVELLTQATSSWKTKPIIINSELEKKDAFAASTAALAKSGTVTLELTLAAVPTVAIYKVHPISAMLIRRMLKINTYSLANILAKKKIIPEFMQENCTPENLTNAVSDLLNNPKSRQHQQQEMAAIGAMLGMNDPISPSEKAVEIVTGYLGDKS